MKTLYLLRHAKSARDHWTGKDFERPLNERGEAACALIADYLSGRSIVPGVICCSTATRARQTLERIAATVGWPDEDGRPPIAFRDEIYLASEKELLGEVRRLDDGFESAMFIGHNPGLEVLAISLTGGGEPEAIERLERKYPTAALAALTFEGARWQDVAPGGGRLVEFVKPSML